MAKEKQRKIDHDLFKVGAIWYIRYSWWKPRKPFKQHRREESGFYQIVSKQSQGLRILQKIHPEPLGKAPSYFDKDLLVDDTSTVEFYCNTLIHRKTRRQCKPIYGPNDPRGTAMRLLYGKRLKTNPRKPQEVSNGR